MKSAKRDASKQILGFKYQELVALLKCLDSDDNGKIYLECFGDISDNTTVTEVKHSINDKKTLHNTHIDFWKTLSNIVSEYDRLRFYKQYILHTTATIKEDSIFNNWNELSAKEKRKRIKKVHPTETIKIYCININSHKIAELDEILGKFQINASEPNAKEFYKKRLLEHPAITKPLALKDREPVIINLFGILSFYLINNENLWEIDLESFNDSFRSILKKYQIDDLLFPIVNSNPNNQKENNFKFIKALKDIDYKAKIEIAVNDYFRAAESQITMISKRPTLTNELESFDDELLEDMKEMKITRQDELSYLNLPDINQYSKRFFDACIDNAKDKTTINGVSGVRSYYPKGRVHHQVEEHEDFKWRLIEDES